MGHHVVTTVGVCAQCGGVAQVAHVLATGRHLREHRSIRCAACGHGLEMDVELSADARAAFVELEGAWTITIVDVGGSRTSVVEVLRSETTCVLAEILGFLRGKPVLRDALLGEVEQLGDKLRAAGAAVTLVRSSSRSKAQSGGADGRRETPS